MASLTFDLKAGDAITLSWNGYSDTLPRFITETLKKFDEMKDDYKKALLFK